MRDLHYVFGQVRGEEESALVFYQICVARHGAFPCSKRSFIAIVIHVAVNLLAHYQATYSYNSLQVLNLF